MCSATSDIVPPSLHKGLSRKGRLFCYFVNFKIIRNFAQNKVTMGFFTKDKPIDCYKKVNKLLKKMYNIKRILILKSDSFTESDRTDVFCLLNDAIYEYNCIVNMDFDGQYVLMKRDVWDGSTVVDYEAKRLSIRDFMAKVSKEIDAIKRITKGAPVVMSEINPNSITPNFFYDDHKIGVEHTIFINSPQYSLPPMFIV